MSDFPNTLSASDIWGVTDQYRAQGGNVWPSAKDPYYSNVELLVTGDGPDHSENSTFLDSGPNNFNIARTGNVTQGNFSPFGSNWSNYFDGNGDYFTVPTNTAFSFGTGDFTIECWVYLNSKTGYPLFAMLGDGVDAIPVQRFCAWALYFDTSSLIFNRYTPGNVSHSFSWNPNLYQWYHVAIARSGTSLRAFVDGTQIGTTITTSQDYSSVNATALHVGRFIAGGGITYSLSGYISNLRIVKGTALYTANFTPPTSPLTSIPGTSLLTCITNRFQDLSTNNFAITVNGNTAVTRYNPFSPGNHYKANNLGTSVYFDGVGDYLSIPDSATFYSAAQNLTLEAWIYPTSTAATQFIISQWGSTSDPDTQSAFNIIISNNKFAAAFAYNASTSQFQLVGTTTINLNQWYHVALVREGSSSLLFVNGNLEASNTTLASLNINNSIQAFLVGIRSGSSSPFAGYVSNLRYVVGTALYSSNFVPPTSPLAVVNNTVLLTCQSNNLVDLSTNNLAITASGNGSVSEFSPFNPTAGYNNWNQVGGSVYLAGGGDYISTPTPGTSYQFGTDLWTIEAWVFPTSTSTVQTIFQIYGTTVDSLALQLNGNTRAIFVDTRGTNLSSGTITSTVLVTMNSWNHLVFTRDSATTLKLYVNGALGGSRTIPSNTSFTDTQFSGNPTIGAKTNLVGNYFVGYISNLRVVRNAAVYSSSFVPPNQPLTAVSGTVLLTCQERTIRDRSTNNLTLTVNGNTVAASFSPYDYYSPTNMTGGSGSMYFDGTGDYLTYTSSSASLGSGDFTLECYINIQAIPSVNAWIYGARSTNISGYLWISSSLSPTFGTDSGTTNLTSSSAISLNMWYHIAVVRSSNTLKMYQNGVEVASQSNSNNYSYTGTVPIGATTPFTTYPFTGYISNLRIVNGTALYTSNFTPPTAPLTAITNTQLLTCATNRFQDLSTNNYTITQTGDVAPSIFSPFDSVYNELDLGGSIYFDGTGDYLTGPSSISFAFGTSPYTVELWVYPTSLSTIQVFVSASTSGGFQLYFDTTSGVSVSQYGSAPHITTGLGHLKVSQWNHVAVSRISTGTNKTTIFINGVNIVTGTDNKNYTVQGPLYVGANAGGSLLNGYISNLRIVKDIALYPGPFSVPRSPLNPIQGTTLLLKGTNGAVVDETGRNIIETVGNTKIVTGTSKWGSSSLYFDGTGDYLKLADSPAWTLGSGNFTLELWYNPSSLSTTNMLLQQGPNVNNRWILYFSTTTGISFDVASAATTIVACRQGTTTGWAINTWYHIAVVRIGSTFTIYVNGIATAVVTDVDTIPDFSGSLYVGGGPYVGEESITGHIDDLRVTRGIARYTQNFNLPITFPKI